MNWIFNASDEDWTPDGLFDGAVGVGPGCLHNTNLGGTPSFSSPAVSLPVAAADPFSCDVRVTADGTGTGGALTVRMRCGGSGGDHDASTIINVPTNPTTYDSGWIRITGAMTGIDTIDGVTVGFNVDLNLDTSYPYQTFVDNVYVAETPPAAEALTHSGGGIPGSILI